MINKMEIVDILHRLFFVDHNIFNENMVSLQGYLTSSEQIMLDRIFSILISLNRNG